MTIFISGGAKNGKSTLAQDLTVALSKGGKHYYVATMISSGAEDDARIRKHIADREGMGFETVECFRNIMDCLQTADSGGVFGRQCNGPDPEFFVPGREKLRDGYCSS